MNSRFIMFCLATCMPLAAQDAPAPKELVVIDLRPKEEKDGFGLTALDGKCNENVFRIADVATDPLKVDLLRQSLRQMLADSGDDKTLTVLNWSIYYNKQVQKSGGMFDSVGIQGYSIPGKKKEKHAGSKCSKKESAGGWYEGSEATTVFFPLVSEFEGVYGGKQVSARVVYSPGVKLTGKFEGANEDREAVVETVLKTSEALATSIVQ